jgi:DNA-binding MarR family transcriptional regulator
MTRIGLVRRVRNVDDKRKLNVFLTPKAQGLKPSLMPYAFRINEVAAAGIPPDDLAVTLRTLRKMSENLTRETAQIIEDGGLV